MKVLIGRDIEAKRHIYHACLQFQPRDIWIGMYVDDTSYFSIYICLIPMFPIHIRVHTPFP